MKHAAATVLDALFAVAVILALSAAVLYLGAAAVHLMLDIVVAGWESVS